MTAHFDTHTVQEPELFYLQDSRGYVGNDVLWWAQGCSGYTTDLSKAHVFTRQEAQCQHDSRHTDVPWPKSYIDGKTRPAVDVQYLDGRAIAHAGIALWRDQERRLRALPDQCVGCGRFISRDDRYRDACPHCGADNRP